MYKVSDTPALRVGRYALSVTRWALSVKLHDEVQAPFLRPGSHPLGF